MKKGFTLIELLAVIVILAIIAIIAVPIVLNIINDSKSSSTLRSAEFYINALENEIMLENMKQGGTFNPNECTIDSGRVLCGVKEMTLKVDGEAPTRGTITFEEGKVTNVNLSYQSNSIILDNKGDLIIDDVPEAKSFGEDSWDTIAANVRIGNLSKYKIGDTKEITLTIEGETKTHTVRIANTSTPEECKQPGYSQTACGFVIEFVDIISTHVMNSTDINVGGWESSEMRIYVNNDILKSFPEDLKVNIINTYVVSGHEKKKVDNYETTDKVYLLSPKEVYGKEGTNNLIDSDSAEAETRQLDYYKSMRVTINIYANAIKNNRWWLRSTSFNTDYGFHAVLKDGKCQYHQSNVQNGISLAFRL